MSTRRPANCMTHRANRPERGKTMKRNHEVEEIIANLQKLTEDASIHHILIVSRTLLKLENEKRGE